jgi:hypothetical protein
VPRQIFPRRVRMSPLPIAFLLSDDERLIIANILKFRYFAPYFRRHKFHPGEAPCFDELRYF